MKRALMRWLTLTAAVCVAAFIVPGIGFDDWPSLIIASLVLGILNAFVKPVLQLLALPIVVVTFGLFLLVINALLLKVTASLVPGFHVAGFWPSVGGSIVISLVSFFLGRAGREPRIVIERRWTSRRTGPPPGKGPVIDV